jgi:hypothetical protein
MSNQNKPGVLFKTVSQNCLSLGPEDASSYFFFLE